MSFMDPLDEIRAFSPGARYLEEGGLRYIDLPQLAVLSGGVTKTVDGLLCLDKHGGYTTRLFLSEPFPGKGNNWAPHVIFGKRWHTWSWNNVPANLRPAQILADHLRGLL